MPKYYRFRAVTPTRKHKRNRGKDKEKEINMIKTDLTLAFPPAPSWYLRRTSWRQSPAVMGLPRQLSATLRTPFHLSYRPILVFKVPADFKI